MWVVLILLAVIVVLAIAGGIAIVAGIPFLLQWLAKENILVTTVKEGTGKAIMRGDSFDHFIMSFAGYHLNDPRESPEKLGKDTGWYEPYLKDESGKVVTLDGKPVKLPDWEVVYHGPDNQKGFKKTGDDFYDDRHPLLKKLGLYWVGLPWINSVYVYGFEWNETFTDKKIDGKERILPRAEPTDFFYVADFTYAIVTGGAETKDRLPTDELTLVTIAIRNPYRALFTGEDWIRRATSAINRHVRNFVSSKGYDELISLAKEECKLVKEIADMWSEEFSMPIIRLSEFLADENEDSQMPRGLKGRYGIEIRTADLQSIELSGTPEEKKEHQEAAAAKYTAEQTAKATILTGTADAQIIKLKGDQEAKALEARLDVIKNHGSDGIVLAGYDAIQESSKGPGNTVIWANNPLTQLADILKPRTEKGGEKS